MNSKRKKIGAFILTISMLFITITTVSAASTANTANRAVKSSGKLLLDSEAVSFDSYNINGNNYFKLRDLAYAISGTLAQFDVTWDGAKNAINLLSNKAYTPVGGEMEQSANTTSTINAILSESKIFLNGKEVRLTAYNINGNNYFKLRDIAETFDFYVGWNEANSTISIDTTKKYVPDTASVYSKIMALQDKYPTGLAWGNDKYYIWKAGIFRGGYGCLAFAFILSDEAFGSLPARQHTDFDKIQVGDIFRLRTTSGEHSVVVIKVDSKGITVAEGNLNDAVYWGREFTWEAVKERGINVMTRYPE